MIMSALDDIAAERRRQIEVEGWDADHDDGHSRGQIALAAAAYAYSGSIDKIRPRVISHIVKTLWPWDWSWWKPTNRRRDLVKAGALILAEIERLDRQQGDET